MRPQTNARRQLLVASTGEPMQPVQLYYALPRDGRERVVRKLEAILALRLRLTREAERGAA